MRDYSNLVFDGCDEIMEFMYINCHHPYCGYAEFQGDTIEFDGTIPDMKVGTCIVVSPKYKGAVFIIGESFNYETFKVNLIKDYGFIDQSPSVELPLYCREQFIECARGNI